MKFSMPMRVEHLAAEALGGDAGAEALARGVDAAAAPAGPPPTTSTSNGSLASMASAARSAAPVSSLARICLEAHPALANISPFRKTAGTAITPRASTSSWNSAAFDQRAP